MTKPDVTKKQRNIVGVLSAALFGVSFLSAQTAIWDGVPLDSWLIFVAVVSLIGCVITGITTTVMSFKYLEEMRSN